MTNDEYETALVNEFKKIVGEEAFSNFVDEIDQSRHQARWFRDLPQILTDLGSAVHAVRGSLAPEKLQRFEDRTVATLRETWKAARQISSGENKGYDEFLRSQELVKSMISAINGWFRSSRIAVGVEVTMDHSCNGRAKIPMAFKIITGDTFDITNNRI
jgi:hypothetical protein